MMGELWELVSLLHRQRWSMDKLESVRRAKLRRLIAHAYAEVPYYRELMQSSGVRPSDIQEFADLSRIPVTTKEMLRKAGPEALARTAKNLFSQHTSGHSGTPFQVYYTAAEKQTRRLREFRMLLSAGRVRPWDELVLLGPTPQRPQRLHRSLGLYRLNIIPCTLSPAELSARFQETRPDVLWVYPTSLKTVLYHTGKQFEELCQPRTLITSAQVMDLPFRKRLQAGSPGMEIVDIYGSSEVGRIAAACEIRDGLHIESDALHVELLREGNAVAAGEYGSVTITALDQLAMPFIRYEQGDLCRARSGECGCGRSSPRLDPPIGRNADMVRMPDGMKVSCAPLDVALRAEEGLVQYRFVQTSTQLIRAELYYPDPPDSTHLASLRREFEAVLDNKITFQVELIPEYRNEGQKFKVFISELEGNPQ